MNAGIYRLVFNAARGLWMVVSEHVRSHQAGSDGATKRARKKGQLKQVFILLSGLALSTGTQVVLAVDAGVVDIDVAATHGSINTTGPVSNGRGGQTQTFNQTSRKAILRVQNLILVAKVG